MVGMEEISTVQTNKCKFIDDKLQAVCVRDENSHEVSTYWAHTSLSTTDSKVLGQPKTLCPLVNLQPLVACILQEFQMKADSAA